MSKHPKSYIVTGGSSGIGRAACLLLTQAGHAVTAGDVDAAAGTALVEEILERGDHAQFVQVDVTDESSVRNLVEQAVTKFGGLDGAINCAGVPQSGQPVWELDIKDWDFGMNVNLRGMFLCVKHQSRIMVQRGGGSIVCISSIAATKGLVNSAEYCASKAGISGLVRAAAVDFAARGVRINALLPGATDTPLARKSREANPKIVGTLQIPNERMATPNEIAAGATWLVSDEAAYMTGSCMVIDGGMSIV